MTDFKTLEPDDLAAIRQAARKAQVDELRKQLTKLGCPKCNSTRTVPPSSFDPTSHHICCDCGHRWNPHDDKQPMDVSP